MRHMSGVRCQVSSVECQVPGVTCIFFSLFFVDKALGLVGEGSVINGATPSSFQLREGIKKSLDL